MEAGLATAQCGAGAQPRGHYDGVSRQVARAGARCLRPGGRRAAPGPYAITPGGLAATLLPGRDRAECAGHFCYTAWRAGAQHEGLAHAAGPPWL